MGEVSVRGSHSEAPEALTFSEVAPQTIFEPFWVGCEAHAPHYHRQPTRSRDPESRTLLSLTTTMLMKAFLVMMLRVF